MRWLLAGLIRWIRWRRNLRLWRKCLAESPKLAHCWREVKGEARIRPGYFEVSGEINSLEELISNYREHITGQKWYSRLPEYVQKGWNEFAKIELFYLIKGRPNDRLVSTLIVSTLDKQLLGVMPGHLSGY